MSHHRWVVVNGCHAKQDFDNDVEKGENAKYETVVAGCIVEIDRILKRMRRKDAAIEKSKDWTRAILAELKAMR